MSILIAALIRVEASDVTLARDLVRAAIFDAAPNAMVVVSTDTLPVTYSSGETAEAAS